MKKAAIVFSYIISSCLIIYLGGVIFLNNYFNNYFYKTPNFIGLTKKKAKTMIPNGTITFKEVGKSYSNLPAGEIFKQDPSLGKVVKRGRAIKVWVSSGKHSVVLPDFKGQQLYEVRNILEEQGIKIKNIAKVDSNLPYDSVITTEPFPGEIVNTEEGISILVSNRVLNKIVKVPDIIGYTLEDATKILNDNHLFVGNIVRKNTPSLEDDIVIGTSLDTGKNISAGTTIDLVVSGNE